MESDSQNINEQEYLENAGIQGKTQSYMLRKFVKNFNKLINI